MNKQMVHSSEIESFRASLQFLVFSEALTLLRVFVPSSPHRRPNRPILEALSSCSWHFTASSFFESGNT
jgi:hypothetical protein